MHITGDTVRFMLAVEWQADFIVCCAMLRMSGGQAFKMHFYFKFNYEGFYETLSLSLLSSLHHHLPPVFTLLLLEVASGYNYSSVA